jgi:Spy/CpxP family protein refolding chaperone
MKKRLLSLAGAAALATGVMFAQTTPPTNAGKGAEGHARHRDGVRGGMSRLMADLNLTEDQKAQFRSAFSAAHQEARPVMEQLKTSKQALSNAVKSGAPDAEIERLSNEIGPLTAKLTAIHTKAFASFYSKLTAEQKEKVGNRMEAFLSGGFAGGRRPTEWSGGREKNRRQQAQ